MSSVSSPLQNPVNQSELGRSSWKTSERKPENIFLHKIWSGFPKVSEIVVVCGLVPENITHFSRPRNQIYLEKTEAPFTQSQCSIKMIFEAVYLNVIHIVNMIWTICW